MRYLSIALLAAVVSVAGACGYDFATEDDFFQCTSDDDCIDGFKCAGHTSLESDDPVTYCVDSKDVEIAVWQETMQAFEAGCDSAWEFEWDAWMVFSDNETPLAAGLPPAQAERDAFIAAGGECVGDASAFGELRIMCRMPKGELVANTASMWAVLYDVGGDPLVLQNQRAVAFTSGVVDADTRMAPAPADVERHHQFDEHLGSAAMRCAAAGQRLCSGHVASCASCTTDADCPLYFTCDDSTAMPPYVCVPM